MQIRRYSGPQPDLLSHGYGAHWDDPDNTRFNTDQYRRTDSIGMALMREGDKFVASANDKVVGAVAFQVIKKCDFGFGDESQDEALLIDNIGSVEPGVGTALMKAVEAEAKRLGLEVLIAPTRWSIKFYERIGYDCSKGYCQKGPEQLGESLMRKLLEAAGSIARFVVFEQLPDDMQQLLHDFADCDEGVSWDALEGFTFPVYDVPTALFPQHKLGYQTPGGDSRDEAHALSIPIDDNHPVVLISNDFVDGRHRLYKARKTGLRTVPAINLGDIGVTIVTNSMGRLRRRFF